MRDLLQRIFGDRHVDQSCADHADCGSKKHCCNFETGKCIKRSDPDAAKVCRISSDLTWTQRPGDSGFNDEVRANLFKAKLKDDTSCDSSHARIYQQVQELLTQRSSPTKRVLWTWMPGAGKTRAMLAVLDAYFDDPRPKLILVPKKVLISNFYEELGRWNSRYQQALAEKDSPGCGRRREARGGRGSGG